VNPLGQQDGAGGFARPRLKANQSTPAAERRMELTSALAAGSSAQAKFVSWDLSSSSYLAQGTAISVYSYKKASGSTGDRLDFVYRPDSQRWEAVESAGGGAWIGVLGGALAYQGSASVNLYGFDGTHAYPTATGATDTCYAWLMLSGDSIPSGTQVAGGIVNGKRVVFGAACQAGT